MSSKPRRGAKSAEIPSELRVLLIGDGGREHALAWRLKKCGSVKALFCLATKNPGIKSLAVSAPNDISMADTFRLKLFIRDQKINLVVVGPEAPLAAGIVDELQSEGVLVFGPCKAAAQLEADKVFAKELMRAASIPTAEARVFTDARAAADFFLTRATSSPENAKEIRGVLRGERFETELARHEFEDAQPGLPVIKASGLAAGKGVVVPSTTKEGLEAIQSMMRERKFGDAGLKVLIEDRMEGPEVSVFALVDGRNIMILDACQDHKRLGEGDQGPNTGGMGAYCPCPLIDGPIMSVVQRDVIVPIVDALRREDIEYRGVLYVGLMMTPAGPKVLEFNVRFGDPECQCLMRRLTGDVARVLAATAGGNLDLLDEQGVDFDIEHDRHICCVVLAAPGYPDNPKKGVVIEGLEEAEGVEGVTVFHAGTARQTGQLVTAGGRVLSIVGVGETLAEAQGRANEAARKVQYPGKLWRSDIGWRAVERAAAAGG